MPKCTWFRYFRLAQGDSPEEDVLMQHAGQQECDSTSEELALFNSKRKQAYSCAILLCR